MKFTSTHHLPSAVITLFVHISTFPPVLRVLRMLDSGIYEYAYLRRSLITCASGSDAFPSLLGEGG